MKGVVANAQSAAVIVVPPGGLHANASEPSTGISEAAQVLVATPAGARRSTVVKISNLTADATNNAINGCFPRLMGILCQNGCGSVSGIATRNQTLAQASGSCQSGDGIRVESSTGVRGVASTVIQKNTMHSYQKNGLSAVGNETTCKSLQTVINGQGPTTGAAENGIQVSSERPPISKNQIIDNISVNIGFAATGILVIASSNGRITGNATGNNQFGITLASSLSESADNNVVTNNNIFGTRTGDKLEICTNNNSVTGNMVASSAEAGVHLDSGCGGTGSVAGLVEK